MTRKLLLPTRQQRTHIRLGYSQGSGTARELGQPVPLTDKYGKPLSPHEDYRMQSNAWASESHGVADQYSTDSISDHNRHCEATENSTRLEKWINDQQFDPQQPQISQQSEKRTQAPEAESARPPSPIAPSLPLRPAKGGGLGPHSGNHGGREALLEQIREVGSRKPAQTASYEVGPEEQCQRGLSAQSTVSAHVGPLTSANQGTEQAGSARAIAPALHSKSKSNPTTQMRKPPPPPVPPKPRSVLPAASPSDISKPQRPAIRNNEVPTISSVSALEVHNVIYSPLPLLSKPAQFNTATSTTASSQNPYPHTLLPNRTHSSTSTRIFTSNCGSWSVQAQLLDWKAGKVWLRKINDVKISVPLSRFSGADIEYVLTEMMQRAEERLSDIDSVRAECQGAWNAVTA